MQPLQAADHAESREIAALFRELPDHVSYRQFHDRLTVEAFLKIRRLATYDLWSDADDEKKFEWLRGAKLIPHAPPDEGFCATVRKDPQYEPMVQALLEAMETIATEKNFREHIEDTSFQDRMARRLKSIALHSLDHRAATKALDTLTERVAPRALPGQGQTVIMLPMEYLNRIEEVGQQVKEIEGRVVGEHPALHTLEDDGAPTEGEG